MAEDKDGNIMGSSQSRRNRRSTTNRESGEREGENIQVWYRHSGQPEIDTIPDDCTYISIKYEREKLEDVGDHHITHMSIKTGVIPALMTPSLKQLQLKNVNPSQLDCLSSLTGLKVVMIWSSDFSAGLPPVIAELETLESLKLIDCQLRELPQSLKSLKRLKELDLALNNFSAGLPPVISEIGTLESLTLMSCQLRDLPQSLKSLKRLKKLDLDYSNFSAGLPPVIGEIGTLESLTLEDCQLRDLPQR
ncbi:uncharacterized protein [Watersipora subatra]|uniref:uncharacterized protein n=1 Tax=Watersipora subatra TaxID=2589382 RepID=UPI00355C5765